MNIDDLLSEVQGRSVLRIRRSVMVLYTLIMLFVGFMAGLAFH